MIYVRITEKSRLATAAAAIKHKIVIRKSPLAFLPVLPWKKGSATVAVIVAVNEGKVEVRCRLVGYLLTSESLTRRQGLIRAKLFRPEAARTWDNGSEAGPGTFWLSVNRIFQA